MSDTIIRLQLEPLDGGGSVATSPTMPGLVAQGHRIVEVAEIARDLVRGIADSCREHGDPLPAAIVGRSIGAF